MNLLELRCVSFLYLLNASFFSNCYKEIIEGVRYICWIFHHFSSFTSRVGTCSTECTFPVSFFIMFHVVFTLLSDFAISLL